MLNLNVQIGLNPLTKHKPIYFKTYSQSQVPYSYSIGEDGQIVAWKKSTFTNQPNIETLQLKRPMYVPVYYMIPSLNGDHGKCVALVLTQLRLINQQEKTYKIVTYHTDNRLRIWQARDGSCINITSHNFFPQKIIGLCENTIPQSRFLFAFSQNSIFIIDCWKMSLIDKIQPKKQVYSQLLKGRVNEKQELQLYDNYHKSYKLDVSKLFKESFIDVGRTIVSIQKVQREMRDVLESLHQQKMVLIHKIWKTQDYKTPLKDIMDSQTLFIDKESIPASIFDQHFVERFPQVKSLFNNESIQITVQNVFLIKGTDLWYFLGMDDGRVFGFPIVQQSPEKYFMVKEQSCSFEGRKNGVKYLGLVENFLVCSWQNGAFRVYTMDNLRYMIDQQAQRINTAKQDKTFSTMSLVNLCISKHKLSEPIKYTLPIYQLCSIPSVSSTRITSHQTAFQLQNNEIIIFDSLHNKVSHFMGIEQKIKVYVVLYMGGSKEYVGIGTETGIELYGIEGYERRISYADWEWSEWNIVGKFESRHDVNSLRSSSKGLQLIEFANRNTINQIEYTSSVTSLLEQTFGPIDTDSFSNQLYSKFYFLEKSQVEKTLHSRSMEKFIAILKQKHNSYRRDNSSNTSFLINCSLNRELDVYSTGSSETIQNTFQDNFVFYSCFLWDLFEIPFLSSLIKRLPKRFILNRRYVSQGIGKTATLYFDLEECVFGLSKYLLTEYAISAISFMQCYVLKQIEMADQLVAVVEYFTLGQRKQPSIYVSGEILSKSIISSNQNIVKASINLLISTIIAGHLDIHPLYEYFVLNLKKMEEEREPQVQSSISVPMSMISAPGSGSKPNSSAISAIFPSSVHKPSTLNHKELTEIQCQWMLYLGLGLIYGKGVIEKQQIKMLLNRIIECVQIQNFINKPDLIQVILKLLNEGLSQTWRELMTKEAVSRLYLDMFRIFFFYDGIATIPQDDKKFNFCFENNSPQHIKRMKQSIIKTIVFLSKEFSSEFIQCLTSETINQKPHPAYPASVIQILRQYLKSQKPSSYLVFYIELLLQCLSPMTPNLRKYVQKNVISTLQLMCTYKSVSFNQTSQRLSIKSNNHLYIYCLRTSTKWRTISLLKEEGKEQIEGVRDEDCALDMSPKGNYIALMTYKKLYIWRLSSGFWSGLLGAFSQRETFELPKGGKNINIVWDQSQSSITVVNQDPSLNKAFKV